MKVANTVAFLLISLVTFAQTDVEITLRPSADNNKCMSIYLTTNDASDILLRGQNYRLFYNDMNLDLDQIGITSEMKNNNFEANMAMHKDGLSKKINGSIPFENHMGFISLNIMPENETKDYVYMAANETLKITDVCFTTPVDSADVMMSNKNVTSEYTAAYSVINWHDVKNADKKMSYTADLNLVTLGIKK